VDTRKEIGRIGEELARKYLVKRGYIIRHKNIAFGHKEIDIVAQWGRQIIFVEVKTRTSFVFGGADTALTAKQIKTLKKAISLYCFRHKIDNNFIRLDLISVDMDMRNRIAKLKHIKDVF